MVAHGVERGRVELRKARVRVLAVQAFLISVDHSLPVETAWVLDGAPVGKFGEVDLREQWLEVGEELVEGRCRIGYGAKERAGLGEMVAKFMARFRREYLDVPGLVGHALHVEGNLGDFIINLLSDGDKARNWAKEVPCLETLNDIIIS